MAKDAAMRDVTMEPLRKEYASHMEQRYRKRVPHITRGKEEFKFVRDIAWKVSIQLISHRTEQSSSFLLSCLVDQLIMKMRRNLFMDLEGLMLLV